MRKSIIPIAVMAFSVALAGCTATPPIEGKVVDKYIEDHTEFTVVVQKASGEKHHFTIEADDWRRVTVGQDYNSADYDEPADD